MANIVKKEVKTYKTYAYCEKCGGVMEPTGQVYTTSPLRFPHECRDCGYSETFLEVYPKIVYEEV